MPELPEVTTTTEGLQNVLPGLVIVDIWTDLAKDTQNFKAFLGTIKEGKFFKKFKKELVGQKIINVERRAKNILINTSGGQTILIHLKMTGHLLYGQYIYNKKSNSWMPKDGERESLFDPYNRFIHVVFSFSNGKQVAFCDSRKFGKVTMLKSNTIRESSHLKDLGPEPLEKTFNYANFKKQLFLKPRGKIKTVLMDQSVISGIGNIYSDEMLWLSLIHPESIVENIPSEKLEILYKEMKDILKKGINFGGDSMSDYRNIDGEKGNFQKHHNVYQKKNDPCSRPGCLGVIIRKVIGSRSSHLCNKCQKLYVK